jgi:hypothetical protein
MSEEKKCHWAMSAINYKNNNRITACPRGQRFLENKSINFLPSLFFNNKEFKDLRLSLKKGEFPSHCKSCKEWEEKGLTSYRTTQNLNFYHDNIDRNFNSDTGESNFNNLEYLEFRFSNTCNFSCLHCMPEYSSSWADIIKKNPSNENDIKFKIVQYEKQIPNQSWTIDEAEHLALDLIKNFPNIKRIDFAGGEPLYQKQFWAFLRKFINHPNVNNCSIVIISNFNTQIDYNELSNLLLHFKQSKIRISVDGGKGIYKYFRTGDWKTLTENIDFFKSINQKTMLEATCTISAYQILDIKNSIIDMFNLNVDRLHHTIVQYPTYLDPSILKSRFLTIIQKDINYIEEYLKKMEYNYKIKTTFEIVDRLRKIYTKSDTNEDDYNRFLYYIDRMDEIKKQNFDEHFPISKTELKC